MKQEVIDDILNTVRFAKWMKPNVAGVKGWFLLEINPLPHGELLPVISDIHFGRDVGVSYLDGHVYHDPSCTVEHALPDELDRLLIKVSKSLKPKTFRVALFPGVRGGALSNQPLAIAFDPLLNYALYPDHPHLNAGNNDIPETLCYTDDVPGLGTTDGERMKEAIRLIAIWLLRHMIWEESRRYGRLGQWIGPAEPSTFGSLDYLCFIDPNGHCRCGKQVAYKKCHMPQDLRAVPELLMPQPINFEMVRTTRKLKQDNIMKLLIKEAFETS